jgi:hypothetical protein
VEDSVPLSARAHDSARVSRARCVTVHACHPHSPGGGRVPVPPGPGGGGRVPLGLMLASGLQLERACPPGRAARAANLNFEVDSETEVSSISLICKVKVNLFRVPTEQASNSTEVRSGQVYYSAKV